MNSNFAHVVPQTSEQSLVRDAVAGVPVHVKEPLRALALEMHSARHEVAHNRISASLECLVLYTIQKIAGSPKSIFGRLH